MPIRCVFDLATSITQQCSAVFKRNRSRNNQNQDYQLLDMMEAAIGTAMNEESKLFEDFKDASAQASRWLRPQGQQSELSRHQGAGIENEQDSQDPFVNAMHNDRPRSTNPGFFVDKLLEIGAEVSLINEIRSVRDKLSIIRKVFEDQRSVLHDLDLATAESCKEFNISQEELRHEFREQLHSNGAYLEDIDRMDKRAERIYSSTTDLLDLKQKHANNLGVLFARDQAAQLAGQRPLMVFTIVTVVFLPLSFIATLFTINIRELPHEPGSSEPSLPLSYVLKYMLSISFGISIPIIIIVLSFDTLGNILREVKRRWMPRFARRRKDLTFDEAEYKVDIQALERAIGAGSNPSLLPNGSRR